MMSIQNNFLIYWDFKFNDYLKTDRLLEENSKIKFYSFWKCRRGFSSKYSYFDDLGKQVSERKKFDELPNDQKHPKLSYWSWCWRRL